MGRLGRVIVALALVSCRKVPVEEPEKIEAICVTAEPWTVGTDAFNEGTDDWGLIGVLGTRVVAVDFDGDGWTDLHVHKGGDEADDFAEGGARWGWLLRNDAGKGFVDVTQASGFRARRDAPSPTSGRAGSVVSFGDVDNDGDLDAFTGLTDLDGVRDDTTEVMLNNGDGTFSLGPLESEIRIKKGDAPAAGVMVDADKDGILDLWVTQNNYSQDRLYHGDGTGNFLDRTKDAGLKTSPWEDIFRINAGLAHSNAWSGAACDLNQDGWPELLAASYGRAPNHLWQASGDGTFVNRSVASTFAYDDNLDYTDNEFFRCYCVYNTEDPICAGIPEPAVVCDEATAGNWNEPYDREEYRLGGNNGATMCRDLDNDGHIDLIQTDIKHWWAGSSADQTQILRNSGKEDIELERIPAKESGVIRVHETVSWDEGDMSGSTLDFDNDGWADIYIGNSDYPGNKGLLFHQVSPMKFEAVPPDQGIDHWRSHGSAVADFDRDGDLDIVVGHSFSRCGVPDGQPPECYPTQNVRLFVNQLGGNALQVKLTGGEGSNRSAIGARVKVVAGGVEQVQEVRGGFGHYGNQDDLVLHFGLGEACEAEVSVVWPDAAGTTSSFSAVSGYRWSLSQGGKASAEAFLKP